MTSSLASSHPATSLRIKKIKKPKFYQVRYLVRLIAQLEVTDRYTLLFMYD